ncbi:MAG: cytochrome c [Cyanobacteria bacterium HKST-UBA06]|nr:cytochrome c [Cyanobacteria bacterium HKST-UBA06]
MAFSESPHPHARLNQNRLETDRRLNRLGLMCLGLLGWFVLFVALVFGVTGCAGSTKASLAVTPVQSASQPAVPESGLDRQALVDDTPLAAEVGESGETLVAAASAADQKAKPATVKDRGKLLYQGRCAYCHGAQGEGLYPQMQQKGIAFNKPAWQSSRSDAAVRAVIKQGRGGMPAYGSVLSEQELTDLLLYLRTLAH